MHISSEHPSLNPATSGRARRSVSRTQIVRPVRLDAGSDSALLFVCQQLADPAYDHDRCSTSMAVRRAVRLYEQHVQRVRQDPAALFREREAVRKMSQMPRKRRARVVLN